MKIYRIEKIMHSGRKGIRLETVTSEKYEGMIGSIVYIDDLDFVKPFQKLHMIIKGHPKYNYWDTTEVINIVCNPSDKKYLCETINTIYVFKQLEWEDKSC